MNDQFQAEIEKQEFAVPPKEELKYRDEEIPNKTLGTKEGLG